MSGLGTDAQLTVKLTGPMDESASKYLRQTFKEIVASSHPTVILDLHSVPSMDASGLGKLLVLRQRLSEQNREIIVDGIQHELLAYFLALRLGEMFTIRSS